ncbi:PH domain-containing protein [Halapricum desulfuricans]|uniref:Putative membrane protein YdbS, contains bPH2 (Bacterial pleckstrin homology) domain n=1 Tax=Halapricum desulfuricans TaxID=2841257 RepID=A0A897NMW7_9EURY|nr:PH domain-containing protein [Halapricum desulfuricans]QSG13784.1 putative membrane protein YdbS, contains bPH2 (bacterial pleckstrin homology) domain [Halapricum desulfuricans]
MDESADTSVGADELTDEESSEGTDPSEEGNGSDPEAYTTDTRTLDPRVRWLWVGRAVIVALVLGGISAAVAGALAPEQPWIGPAVFVVATALGTAHALLLYRSWSYEVREDSLFLDRGVITRVRTVVPYVRVQHIDTSRGPIERAMGLSSLVVYTAGSRGADVTIPGIRPLEADDLQTRLKALAIESEGEDAV